MFGNMGNDKTGAPVDYVMQAEAEDDGDDKSQEKSEGQLD